MLILRRSNCIATASGIVTLCTVHPLRAESCPLSTGALYGRLQRVMIPDAITVQFDLLRMSRMSSKHVGDYNVIHILLQNKGIVH
jgi:hypothetical protein